MRQTHQFPSDLTDRQWEIIKELFPRSRRGRPRRHSLRKVLNAVFYLHRTGCQWRYLPDHFPNWKTVYYHFTKWAREGLWERIEHRLHELMREKEHRSRLPHLAIMDAQSVRAARGEERNFDGFKRVMGRKRNILVDAFGIIIGCKVHAADRQETITGKKVLEHLPENFAQSLEKIVVDQGYRGALLQYAETYFGIEVLVTSQRLHGTNMKFKRWIVERTFAWLNHFRRMSRDYERKVIYSEAMLYISMYPILLERLDA